MLALILIFSFFYYFFISFSIVLNNIQIIGLLESFV